ncbi:MAG: hypothetical protein ABIS18_06075 [Actinomycetota bacterium]
MGITVGFVAVKQPTIARLLVGVFGGIIFFIISMNGRLTALRLSIVFLVFLGLIRRLLIPFAGWSEQDPLLLVGPACAFMIWLNSRERSPKRRDGLSVLVVLFAIWVVAQIFNPRNGSLLNGALGSLFWIPPLMWFTVGKTFSERVHRNIANILILVAIPVALHGLRQTYFGLFSFEYTWLGVSNIGASVFYEGFKIRSFGPLVSPQEYGAFLSVAITFLWGTILAREPHRWYRVGLLGFLVFALFMQGARSIFLLTVLMLTVTTIVWTKNVGLKIMVAFGIGATVFLLRMLPAPDRDGTTAASAAITHQLSGLLNPGESTAGLHMDMITGGFDRAWQNPFGLGTAAASLVVTKAGATESAGTEFDISTLFVAMGIPAGIAYLFFLIMLFAGATKRFLISRNWFTIASLGIFVATFGNIWSGGLYAVSSILWFSMGGLSRSSDPVAVLQDEEEEAALAQSRLVAKQAEEARQSWRLEGPGAPA